MRCSRGKAISAAGTNLIIIGRGLCRRLEQVFQSFDEKAKGKTCHATIGLLEEGDEIAADFKGSPAINAALISAAQKVEHYEMASYGCLHEWAGLLGNQKAASLLEDILSEEKAANEKLTDVARKSGNEEALGDGDKGSKQQTTARRLTSLRQGISSSGPGQKGRKMLTR